MYAGQDHLIKSLKKRDISVKLKKKYNHRKTRRDLFRLFVYPSMHKWRVTFYIPSMWKIFFVKNSKLRIINVFLYSNVYKFRFCLYNHISKIFYDSASATISVDSTFVHKKTIRYLNIFREVLFSVTRPLFKKVKFKGKGYYIYKNYRNTITPQFGYAHRIYFYSYFAYVKFLSKTSILVFGLLSRDVFNACNGIKAMRPINIFTGRGVRFSRQIVYRKTGKVSTYR